MLDLFTTLWGEDMIESYLNWALPSLIQEGNIPRAKEFIHEYAIYASDEAKERVTAHKNYDYLESLIKVRWETLRKGEWEVNSNLRHQLGLSCSEKHYIKVLSPDCVVGNGSLYNIVELSNKKFNPILYGGCRVTEVGWETLREFLHQKGEISNRQLITLGVSYIEQVGYPFKDKGTHFLVSHTCPTPCILPDKWLIDLYAKNPSNNGGFDHTIPYMMIEKGYPWHFIDHSDIYFQVERGRHLLNEIIGSDVGWKPEKHAAGCKLFATLRQIWKGEPLNV